MPLRRIEPSYFNPRSSCEERPAREKPSRRQGRISIHAPHARSDPPCRIRCAMSSAKISIHAPHARSDYYTTYTAQKSRNFNPRSSCEERLALNAAADAKAYISIHAPHARSDPSIRKTGSYSMKISIHAPHARSDGKDHLLQVDGGTFQSTLLMRGATVSILGIDLPDFIIYFSRTYPFSPKMPTSRHLSCKLHFLCDGTSHFGDL